MPWVGWIAGWADVKEGWILGASDPQRDPFGQARLQPAGFWVGLPAFGYRATMFGSCVLHALCMTLSQRLQQQRQRSKQYANMGHTKTQAVYIQATPLVVFPRWMSTLHKSTLQVSKHKVYSM